MSDTDQSEPRFAREGGAFAGLAGIGSPHQTQRPAREPGTVRMTIPDLQARVFPRASQSRGRGSPHLPPMGHTPLSRPTLDHIRHERRQFLHFLWAAPLLGLALILAAAVLP